MIINKKLNQIVTELFTRARKLNISTAFITQLYLPVQKDVRRNCTHFFIIKINESFNKFHLIIHQIFTLMQNHIFFSD